MNNEKLLKKIIIGTAQFGSNYGITNKKGKIKPNKINEILDYLKKNKIKFIDTAMNYGNAEKILGKNNLNKFQITTKLPRLPVSQINIKKWVNDKLKESFSRLKCKKIYALLLHNPDDLLSLRGQNLFEEINNLKKNGLVSKIGISIYDYEKAKQILEKYKFDVIQAPFNILDQRLMKYINFFKKKKIEIHARSIFLQGLLIDKKVFRSKKFKKWKKFWDNWDYFCLTKGINYTDVAINFVISQKKIDYFVLGFQDLMELQEVVNYIKKSSVHKKKIISHLSGNKKFVCYDQGLINPINWH